MTLHKRLRRIDDVHMNVVVMTNLAREHLEEGERMEDYVSTAASLFSRLEDPDTQRAVINVDGTHVGDEGAIGKPRRHLWIYSVLLSPIVAVRVWSACEIMTKFPSSSWLRPWAAEGDMTAG